MKILKQSESGVRVHYALFFKDETSGSGFAFDCDEHGNVDVSKLKPTLLASYQACLTGQIDNRKMTSGRVLKHAHAYRIPAVGECACGAHVVLFGFTNTCERCERDYNSAGQLLAPREQWGKETGEHWSDII